MFYSLLSYWTYVDPGMTKHLYSCVPLIYLHLQHPSDKILKKGVLVMCTKGSSRKSINRSLANSARLEEEKSTSRHKPWQWQTHCPSMVQENQAGPSKSVQRELPDHHQSWKKIQNFREFTEQCIVGDGCLSKLNGFLRLKHNIFK